MKRDGHDNVRFFIGPEVEMTPAHGKKTLFVVGEQPTTEIEKHAKEQGATHVFLGANHSFDDTVVIESWITMITELLNKGFTVTLDYSVEFHGFLLGRLPQSVWRSRNFIPLVSVRIPKIENSGPNLTVKIDDIDFAATNPGVWCMHYTELTDSNRFTGWNDYGTDLVIGEVVAEPVAKMAPEPGVTTDSVVISESVVLNVNDIGLDTTGASAMSQKAAQEPGEVVGDEVKEEVTEQVTAGVNETVVTTEVKESPKKKGLKKND